MSQTYIDNRTEMENRIIEINKEMMELMNKQVRGFYIDDKEMQEMWIKWRALNEEKAELKKALNGDLTFSGNIGTQAGAMPARRIIRRSVNPEELNNTPNATPRVIRQSPVQRVINQNTEQRIIRQALQADKNEEQGIEDEISKIVEELIGSKDQRTIDLIKDEVKNQIRKTLEQQKPQIINQTVKAVNSKLLEENDERQ